MVWLAPPRQVWVYGPRVILRRPALGLLMATVLMTLTPGPTWAADSTTTDSGSPVAASSERAARSVNFWAKIGPKVRVSCYIYWLPDTDDPSETRCDRYRVKRGVVTGETQLLLENLGRGKKINYSDTVGDRVGKRLAPGRTVTGARFIRCTAKPRTVRCVDTYTGHGFVMKRKGYQVF